MPYIDYMRLPSVEQLVGAARRTVQRFPLVLLCALISATAASLLPDSEIDDEVLTGILYASTLGIPLFLAIALVAERGWISNARAWTARLLAVVLLVALYFSRAGWSEQVEVLRYVQLSVAAHLLVAVAPYVRVREWNGFWQYNRSLLLRFLLAGVFSVVLYVGLAIALAAIDNLLGVDVDGDTYFRMWCWIAFLFNTWFFAAGVPDDFEVLERETDYPGVLKVFAQYILSPLVTVYLLILIIYLGRVLVTRIWPSGWIGFLVSAVAAAGILSLLLLYPVEEREENRWVRQYARWFWVGLIPANIMLLLAIWKRIQQYAITEPRYFLVILALWLGGISLFYVLTRSRNIKVIPASLAVLAVLTFAGPWSAYSVSLRSQTGRLAGLLERNGMLTDGAVRQPSGEVPTEDRKEISAVLRYLVENHGTASIAGWFPEGRLAEVDTLGVGTEPSERYEAADRAALIAAEMGVEYVGSWTPGEGESFNFYVDQDGPPLAIAGYDYVLRNRTGAIDTIRVEEPPVAFAYDSASLSIRMLRAGQELISIPLTPLIDGALEYARAHAEYARLPADLLTVEGEADGARLGLSVTAIGGFLGGSGHQDEGEPEDGDPADTRPYRVTTFSADYFFTMPSDGPEAPADTISNGE